MVVLVGGPFDVAPSAVLDRAVAPDCASTISTQPVAGPFQNSGLLGAGGARQGVYSTAPSGALPLAETAELPGGLELHAGARSAAVSSNSSAELAPALQFHWSRTCCLQLPRSSAAAVLL